MKKGSALFALAICVADVALASPPRSKLPGVGGVLFGTTLAAAQKKLGAGAKLDTDPTNPKIKILLSRSKNFYGDSFAVNYTFGKAGRFTEAYLIANIKPGDYAPCRQHWNGVISKLEEAYGRPDTEEKDLDGAIQSHSTEFKFADGASLEASLLGCLLMIHASSSNAVK